MKSETLEKITAAIVALGIIGGIAYSGMHFVNKSYKKEMEKIRQKISTGILMPRDKVDSYCQTIMRRYDVDGNGMIEPEEGVEMSRNLGYKKVLPSREMMFNLQPKRRYVCYEYPDYTDNAVLEIFSAGSNMRFDGLLTSGSGKPAFYDSIEIPVKELEKISNEERNEESI
jgi:hypothetical protein